jgi:hypothetical protein
MTQRIEDYAMFGDRGTAGFVGLDGSINLYSIPRFVGPRARSAGIFTSDAG